MATVNRTGHLATVSDGRAFALMIPGMETRRDIYTISRLNSELRQVLEGSFPLLWVQGEISNLSAPRSGHLYFSLKDSHAQIRCALFRNKRNLLRFAPANGDEVLLRARVALYEPRGDCQLIVEHMEPAGVGSLRQAFEDLKAKLQAEGLFESERKLPLPAYPGTIGVISSPSGAAVRDILHVLRRRFPAAAVILYPAAVQGAAAPAELREALQLALARKEVDVLIIGRGGGSEEDLAVFNDEALARAIAASTIPVISAVGHETDFTIADFVADRRAPTPSAAAELATPDGANLTRHCAQLENRLRQSMRRELKGARTALQQLHGRLQRVSPQTRLYQQQQRLDEIQVRLARSMQLVLANRERALQHALERLRGLHPQRELRDLKGRLVQLHRQLQRSMQRALQSRRERLQSMLRALQVVSPLATLERGYSIVLRGEDAAVVRNSTQVAVGDAVRIRLASGELTATVESVANEAGEPPKRS